MSKVRSTMTLSRISGGLWQLDHLNYESFIQQCVDKFIRSDEVQSIILELEIRAPYVEKTLSQLGYLHAAVWPVFYQYYRDQGIQVESKEQMEDVRTSVKLAIGFVKKIETPSCETMGWTHRPDVHWKSKVARSFEGASKMETAEIIDQIIRLAAEFGMIVPGPEEYLEKHNAKEFE